MLNIQSMYTTVTIITSWSRYDCKSISGIPIRLNPKGSSSNYMYVPVHNTARSMWDMNRDGHMHDVNEKKTPVMIHTISLGVLAYAHNCPQECLQQANYHVHCKKRSYMYCTYMYDYHQRTRKFQNEGHGMHTCSFSLTLYTVHML